MSWFVILYRRAISMYASRRIADGAEARPRLSVKRVYISDRTDWYHVGHEFREYLRECGGQITACDPDVLMSKLDCFVVVKSLAEHRVSLAVEYVMDGKDYVITYHLTDPVTFPPDRGDGWEEIDQDAARKRRISSSVLSARLVLPPIESSDPRELDVTEEVSLSRGPDLDFYRFAGVRQYAWAVARYAEIRRQNREAFHLIGKKPPFGSLYPPADSDSDSVSDSVSLSSVGSGSSTEEEEDEEQDTPVCVSEPGKTLRVIFGDGAVAEYDVSLDDYLLWE
eukprot:jgi/Mesvir1/5646/Mv15664-RA.1